MSNEWFDIACINHDKVILHGQLVGEDGLERTIEQVLTDEQRKQLEALDAKHEREIKRLLRSFVVQPS